MSRQRLEEHRSIWAKKPALADVYGVWFDAILGRLPPGGPVLEVGAGPGFFAERARLRRPDLAWVSLDVAEAPWLDVVADALRLPVGDAVFAAVLGLDVLHHLALPGSFFAEASRVMRPGGRLVFVEPWVSPLSYPIYRWLHHEGCHVDLDPWRPFGPEPGAKDAFEGDGAIAWKLLRGTPPARWRELGLEPPRFEIMNGFAYLLSMGFQPLSLLPRRLTPLLQALDRRLAPAAPWLGLRVVAEWRRGGS